jgi:hypothetical protein
VETNPCGPSIIAEQFGEIEAFMTATGHEVYNGEWMANDPGDLQSRINWMTAVREASEDLGIGWAVWDAGGNPQFLFPSTGEWDEALLSALFD